MYWVLAAIMCWAQSLRAETISEAVTLENLRYLAKQQYIDISYTPKIVASFEAVRKHVPEELLMLKVVNGPRIGTTNGSSILMDQSVEQYTEIQRQFVIAHEAGHISLDHLAKKLALLRLYVPGDITYESKTLRAVNTGPEMKALSHKIELEADLFALKILIANGYTRDQVVGAFMGVVRNPDSQTHPSSYRRIMNMRRAP